MGNSRSIVWLLARMAMSLTAASVASFAASGASHYDNWQALETDLIAKKILRQWIPMRDGVRLDAEIYLPNTASPPYPTILVRSPYPAEKTLTPSQPMTAFVENGYAIVFENERGRYWSEGGHEFLARAGEDGYDTVDWISKQSWSNGKVGTIGCSSTAENQLKLITAAHPAHVAAIAQGPGAGIGRIGPYAEQGNMFRGGALQLFFATWYRDYVFYGEHGDSRPQFPADLDHDDRVRLSRYFKLWPNYGWGVGRDEFDFTTYYAHLPVIALNEAVSGPRTDWERFSSRTPADPAWNSIQFANEGDTFGVPTIWAFSWYDIAIAPNVALYNYAREHTSTERARDAQQMIIGPLLHCQFGREAKETVVGARKLGDARFDYTQRYLDWFDYWLKGKKNEAMARPQVQYYQMGANQWISGDRFPPAGTRSMDLYLDSAGKANTLYGDGTLQHKAGRHASSDAYIYDPLRAVPTLGGGACCMGPANPSGAFDQSGIEMRNDVLVYTSPVLEKDLSVAGFIDVDLYVSSDAKDTDFTAKLIDVYPDGTAYNLDDNIMRARYREGWNKKVLMQPGKVYKVPFAPMITANTFKQGHRIRLEISSSNFPRYERNLNTGGNNYDESKPVLAHNHIYHSSQYPSRITLPVVSGDL